MGSALNWLKLASGKRFAPQTEAEAVLDDRARKRMKREGCSYPAAVEKELQVDPSLYAQYEKELAAGQTYNTPEPPDYLGSTMAHTKSGVFAGNGDDDDGENDKEKHSPAAALTDHGMYARRRQATSNDDMTDQECKRRK